MIHSASTRSFESDCRRHAAVRALPAPHSNHLSTQSILLGLNRTAGNQAVNQIIQTKLRLNAPGDQFEQEADQIADQIMQTAMTTAPVTPSGPANVQRKCDACSGESSGSCSTCAKDEVVRLKPAIGVPTHGSAGRELNQTAHKRIDRQRGHGQPLSKQEREFFEPALGHDLSNVRLHNDEAAADSAHSLRARAFTTANNIFFAAGQYVRQSRAGLRLLAHELVHVIQQSGTSAGVVQRQAVEPGAPIHTSGGTSTGKLSNVPSEKWSDQIENEYRKRGDELRANAIRACRLQGGAACAVLLTAREVEELYGLGRAAGGDKNTITAIILKMGLALGPHVLVDLVVRVISDLFERTKFQSELRKQGFIILEDPLAVCISGCHLPSKPGFHPDLLPPMKPVDRKALEQWLGPPPSSPAPEKTPNKLDFFHGTRWSIAKTIPGKVKPIGGGDFASGFYTHHDANPAKALGRSVDWGRRMAKQPPPEPYAGVIRFGVAGQDYQKLFSGNKGKVFDLKRTDQPDFKEKQKAWLDFITSTGRTKEPVFKEKRQQWVHDRKKPQPDPLYNIVTGPFYTPLRGTKDVKPKPEEFKPFAEGKDLPQQVTWAKEGIDLLNSGKAEKELMQFDAKTGKRKDPIDPVVANTQQLDIEKMTEESQLGMGE